MRTIRESNGRRPVGAILTLALTTTWVAMAVMFAAPAEAQEGGQAATGKNARVQISGVGWATYRYQLADEPARGTPGTTFGGDNLPQNTSSFDVDRVYLTADYAMTERFSWRTMLEAANHGGNLQLFIKQGYFSMRAPFNLEDANVRFGQFSHVMTPHQESVWRHRIIARVPIDRFLGISTTWVGIGGDATLLDERMQVDLAITNEMPYNRGPRSRYEAFMGRLTLTPVTGDVTVGLTGWGQTTGREAPAGAPAEVRGSADNRTNWFGVFPYIRTGTFTLAGELNQRLDRAPSPAENWRVSTRTAQIISGFALADLTPRFGLFGRVDLWDADTDIDDNEVMIFMAGLSHAYTPNIRSILDVSYTSFAEPSDVEFDPDVTLSARIEVTL